MLTVNQIMQWMESLAPLTLSETWDNTGLLLGDPENKVERVMTCLTLTPESVEEAIAKKAELVIAHHPMPFKPLRSITTRDGVGRLLWKLASAGVSIYSPHTAWDSAANGINSQLAKLLKLRDVLPMIVGGSGSPTDTKENVGTGRCGLLESSKSLPALAKYIASVVPHSRPQIVDAGKVQLLKVGIACGSGGSLLNAALQQNCDVMLTGEATFHTCLEAQSAGVALVLIGHFASEKFAMDQLAILCGAEFPKLTVWSSLDEHDPVQFIQP